MLIRHKLVLLFIVFSGVLLCLFSLYIYIAAANSRKNIFLDRLKKKAHDTQEIYNLNDKVAEKVIISIPEQSEYVFDENNRLIFAIDDMHDFSFDSIFFKSVAKSKEYAFSYRTPNNEEIKEGYAYSFGEGKGMRTIVITAYNITGFGQLQELKFILIIGNVFFLGAVGIVSFFFSSRAFQPINDLVKQAESVQDDDLNFRLTFKNPKDEIGIVASSFNRVLDRIQTVVESQKSFISYASHELRTPLSAINGILETAMNYDRDKDAMKESLKAAHKEIQKATILVNGLLQLAKIETAHKRDESIRVNIVDLLLDVISFYKLKKPEQEFVFDIPDSMQGIYIEVNAHPQFLRTALLNVIDNASKYSFQQKIHIKLILDGENRIKINVIDKGIGIGSEDRSQLFDIFYRGKNVAGVDGFGLGLSLTQKIISLHGGDVRLFRNQLQGMTAEIILPAIISSAG